jgi:hypothetical protein
MAVSEDRQPGSARLRDDLLLWLAAGGGALAWTLQLWLNWLLADLGCRLQPDEFTLLGIGTTGWWLIIGLATGVLAAVAAIAAYRLMRRHTVNGPRRFVAAAGLVLNLLLLGTIVMGATSPIFVPPC